MRTLGLSFDFHDSSVALVENGKLLFSTAEEHFTRQKHDSHFPFFAIRSALESHQLTMTDIDTVVFYESPEKKFSRLLDSSLNTWPLGAKEFSSIMSTWLSSKLWTKARIAHNLQISPEKIITIPHHQSHAYQAFVGSGFAESAILIMDAVGEWDSGSTYKATWKNGRPEITLLSEMKFPHSLGLLYSTFTEYLGFKPMNDECTTMALAAFGTPVYYEALKNIITLTDDGEFKLPRSHFNFHQFYRKPYTQKLLDVLGAPRTEPTKLSLSSFEHKILNAEEQRYVDIASSIQKLTEEVLLRKAKKLLHDTGLKNLCLAGGVALNCVANTRLLKESGCHALFIPPDPGDGGASIGAAFAGYFMESKCQSSSSLTPYSVAMGPRGQTSNFAEMLSLLKPHGFQKYRQLQTPFRENLKWDWIQTRSTDQLCADVAQLLLEGNIVGWFQGAMELGPRALGQRSILIRPNDLELAQRLSAEVKIRAPFRPYALSMTPLAAEKLLETPSIKVGIPSSSLDPRLQPLHTTFTNIDLNQKPMEWMQLAIPVNADYQSQVRAGIHIDGTTRPQIIKDPNNPYFQLLQHYGQYSGLECLLNTSFNEKDYPIVNTDTEALMMFARTSMDVVVINNLIIKKSYTHSKGVSQ